MIDQILRLARRYRFLFARSLAGFACLSPCSLVVVVVDYASLCFAQLSTSLFLKLLVLSCPVA